MSKPLAPKSIGPFTRYLGKPSSMRYGYLYEANLPVPFSKGKRKIHVWLPRDYSFLGKKKHPVLYMADGQNMVDVYLTRFGDWHLDRVIEKLRQQGYETPILVGIDSPHNSKKRSKELNPPYPTENDSKKIEIPDGIADIFLGYIVDTLKPLIDSLFISKKGKEDTAIGGSSMGGIMAFYGFLLHPETFGFSLSYSVPFFFYKEATWKKILLEFDPSPRKNGKLALYVGGKGFEKMFAPGSIKMEEFLRKHYGFDEDHLEFTYDPEAEHQEEYWSKNAVSSLAFWLKKSI